MKTPLEAATDLMWNDTREKPVLDVRQVARLYKVSAKDLHKALLDRVEAELKAKIAEKKKDAI